MSGRADRSSPAQLRGSSDVLRSSAHCCAEVHLRATLMKVVQTSGCGSRHPQLCPDFPPPVETVDHPTVSNELHSQDKAEMQAIPAAISNFEVGTEQWRTDLSDVVLPTPAYDSDSD
eukprot:s4209_g5.t1